MYIAIIILGVSIVGLVLLLGFKAIEHRSGRRLILRSTRDRAGAALDAKLAKMKETMPRTAARATRLTARIMRAYASFGIAKALMGIESFLEGTLKHLRRAPRSVEQSGQASRFLREVAAYKRLLAKEEEKEEAGSEREEDGSSTPKN